MLSLFKYPLWVIANGEIKGTFLGFLIVLPGFHSWISLWFSCIHLQGYLCNYDTLLRQFKIIYRLFSISSLLMASVSFLLFFFSWWWNTVKSRLRLFSFVHVLPSQYRSWISEVQDVSLVLNISSHSTWEGIIKPAKAEAKVHKKARFLFAFCSYETEETISAGITHHKTLVWFL